MKKQLLLFTLIIVSLNSKAQTEDFEDETVGSTSFTLNGELYVTSGDFLVNEFTNFSCDGNMGVNKYLDTGYLDGASSGIFGTISKQDNSTFIVLTSSAQCGFSARDDGDFQSDGVLQITGFRQDNSTISEQFSLSPPDFNTLVPFTFSSAVWEDVELISLQFEIISGDFDYFAIDNLSFKNPILSNEDFISDSEIKFGPNPTSDVISITGLSKSNEDYFLINSIGQIIKQGRTNLNGELSISFKEQKNGAYFLKINQNIIRIIKK